MSLRSKPPPPRALPRIDHVVKVGSNIAAEVDAHTPFIHCSDVDIGGKRGGKPDESDAEHYRKKFVSETLKSRSILYNIPKGDKLASAWLSLAIRQATSSQSTHDALKAKHDELKGRGGALSPEHVLKIESILDKIVDAVSTVLCVTAMVGDKQALFTTANEVGKLVCKAVGVKTDFLSSFISTHAFRQSRSISMSYVTSGALQLLLLALEDVAEDGVEKAMLVHHLPSGIAYPVMRLMGMSMQPDIRVVVQHHDFETAPIDQYLSTSSTGPMLPDISSLLTKAMPPNSLPPDVAVEALKSMLHPFTQENNMMPVDGTDHTTLATALARAYWALVAFCQFQVNAGEKGLSQEARMSALTIMRTVDSLARQSLGDFSSAGDFLARIKEARSHYNFKTLGAAIDAHATTALACNQGCEAVVNAMKKRGYDERHIPFWVYATSTGNWSPSNAVSGAALFAKPPKRSAAQRMAREFNFVLDSLWTPF